ncbi:hypothetical protein HNP49_001883 [Pseudomonas fluvialis]|uniref:Uncharacterized protein n=1 Tax=Pseudomonas fluvialis TaxID=1793966 RepID=A0A7X0BTT6_9PSED|nr:hypothetical protein [Pseudomonas fluvialis]
MHAAAVRPFGLLLPIAAARVLPDNACFPSMKPVA